jgi:hypothetical protein
LLLEDQQPGSQRAVQGESVDGVETLFTEEETSTQLAVSRALLRIPLVRLEPALMLIKGFVLESSPHPEAQTSVGPACAL